MTSTFNRGLIATAAVGAIFAALVLSGGPSLAFQPGINAGGKVVACGHLVGQDPDINVQAQLLRDGCDPTGGDGGSE